MHEQWHCQRRRRDAQSVTIELARGKQGAIVPQLPQHGDRACVVENAKAFGEPNALVDEMFGALSMQI